jgi:signal transduction histidine kinase
MKGSPVRGHDKAPIVRLNAAPDLQTFQADLIRLVAIDAKPAEILFSLVDDNSKPLALPSWMRSYVDRYSALQTKLEQGEMVGISYPEESPVLRPANATRSSVVLIPVICDATLLAVIGLVSPLDGPQPSAEDIEAVRQLAYDAGPILGRLRQLETLRHQNEHLTASAASAARVEEAFGKLVEEKKALEAILQMRAYLHANLAHDLRTPLAAIRGYARMISDGRGGPINETQKDYLRVVTENTNRLVNIVTWMSQMTETSPHNLQLRAFDLRDLWTECVDRMQPAIRDKALKLDENIPDEKFVITADHEKLTHAIKELLKAIVSISTVGATIDAELSRGREGAVTVRISNKTASIPPDVLSKVFERSFPATTLTTENADAAAITLSGVYDIVGMHGGRIFVNSTTTQGATFLFTLPPVTVVGEENSHEQAVNSGSRRR